MLILPTEDSQEVYVYSGKTLRYELVPLPAIANKYLNFRGSSEVAHNDLELSWAGHLCTTGRSCLVNLVQPLVRVKSGLAIHRGTH